MNTVTKSHTQNFQKETNIETVPAIKQKYKWLKQNEHFAHKASPRAGMNIPHVAALIICAKKKREEEEEKGFMGLRKKKKIWCRND